MPEIHSEEFRVNGDALVAKLKELLREGNIRRIIIKNDKGEVLIEVPLTLGMVGAIVLPVWAALGAIAALAANLTIVVEKVDEIAPPASPCRGQRSQNRRKTRVSFIYDVMQGFLKSLRDFKNPCITFLLTPIHLVHLA